MDWHTQFAEWTPDRRRREIIAILAKGLLRLRKSTDAGVPPQRSTDGTAEFPKSARPGP
jgi:hypothetical protein